MPKKMFIFTILFVAAYTHGAQQMAQPLRLTAPDGNNLRNTVSVLIPLPRRVPTRLTLATQNDPTIPLLALQPEENEEHNAANAQDRCTQDDCGRIASVCACGGLVFWLIHFMR